MASAKDQGNDQAKDLTDQVTDQVLWQDLIKDVRPLHTRPAKRTPPPIAIRTQRAEPTRPQAPHAIANPKGLPRPVDLRGQHAPGLDRASVTRLRRGKVALEGRLDLHGLTQEQAYTALHAFLGAAVQAGKRTVLVITGKGGRQDGHGVLRTRVPQWLSHGSLAQHVLAFSYAHRRDGEHGALYIVLRRPRR